MKYDAELIKSYSTKEFEEKYEYKGKDLGCNFTDEGIVFKVWSPLAEKITLNIYKSGEVKGSYIPGASESISDKINDNDNDKASDNINGRASDNTNDKIKEYPMTPEDKGVWSCVTDKDIENLFYDFTVEHKDGSIYTTIDPYAKACGVNGRRGMVVDLSKTDPEGWDDDNRVLPNSVCDCVIYEMHIRDFSADPKSGIKNRGKFLGISEKGTSYNGYKTGMDYLKELGITHVHLLPFYDYTMLDETEPYDENKYNWGYDPLNYNVPEGSYSSDPYDGRVRIKELKQMIKELHENGIGVIMDVVYNHTFNEDFSFNKLVPGYFYRFNEKGKLSNGSRCGNDVASERCMVSRFISDSVYYWAKEYHIDGFRFDLLGLLDTDTINDVRKKVDTIDDRIILYGEGWNMDTALSWDNVKLANQKNINELDRFAMFNDGLRDAVKGSIFHEDQKGFISGDVTGIDVVKDSLKGLPEWCDSPEKTINYTSCHDNYTLYDKILMCNEGITREEAVKQNKLAAAIVILSQGIVLLHAGEELLRQKVDEEGNYVSDSVRSSDKVNSIKWEDLDKEEVRDVVKYYQGLISFRKTHPEFRLTGKDDVESKIEFISDSDDLNCFIAYTVKMNGGGKYLVAFNGGEEAKSIDISSLGCKVQSGVLYVCGEFASSQGEKFCKTEDLDEKSSVTVGAKETVVIGF